MKIKEVIDQTLKKHNGNLVGSQKLISEGNTLILSLDEKKNKLALIVAYFSIVIGGYFIYLQYSKNSPTEIWPWGLALLGIFAVLNRKKLSNERTIIDIKNKTIKYFEGSDLVNSILFSDANDFLIDSVKMKGGGFGLNSVVYVKNGKGKIMLGVLHEKNDSEEYLELLQEIFTYKEEI